MATNTHLMTQVLTHLSQIQAAIESTDNKPTSLPSQQKQNVEKSLHFLNEAYRVLSTSSDYETMLQQALQLATPLLGDVCFCNLVGTDNTYNWGTGKQFSFPVSADRPDECSLSSARSADMASSSIAHLALTANEPVCIPYIEEQTMRDTVTSVQHAIEMHGQIVQSQLTVPLVAKEQALATFTFYFTQKSSRHYTSFDVELAQQLANISAMALENSRLMQKVLNYKKHEQRQDMFISMVGHELKSHVSSVQLYTRLVQHYINGRDDQEASELAYDLVGVEKQIDVFINLVNDLLDMSGLNIGKFKLRKKHFRLDQLIDETVNRMRNSVSTHCFEIKTQNNIRLYGDEARIEQVLTNLLTNAVKYSPQAEKVRVSVEKDQMRAIVRVQDYGIGIAESQQNKIFEQFYQVSNAREQLPPGLGLGLYISHEIIKQHKGHIWVESKPSQGATFCFALPLQSEKQVMET